MPVVRVRWAAALVVLLLSSAGCSATVQDPAAPGEPPSEDQGAAAPGGDSPGPAAPATTPPGDAGAQPGPDDLGPLGQMCRTYLRAERITVEIDWQQGAQPQPAAVAHLLSVLGQVTGAQVSQAGGNEIAADTSRWDSADLRAAAQRNRSEFSRAGVPALYVLSLRGEFAQQDALGVAYRASEFAMFPDRMGGLTALLGGRAALERAVLVHELGHLLCLINIGFRSTAQREDAEHPHHSTDRSSVMHWAIDTSAVGQLFSGPPPADFSAQDREDLAGLASGRY